MINSIKKLLGAGIIVWAKSVLISLSENPAVCFIEDIEENCK